MQPLFFITSAQFSASSLGPVKRRSVHAVCRKVAFQVKRVNDQSNCLMIIPSILFLALWVWCSYPLTGVEFWNPIFRVMFRSLLAFVVWELEGLWPLCGLSEVVCPRQISVATPWSSHLGQQLDSCCHCLCVLEQMAYESTRKAIEEMSFRAFMPMVLLVCKLSFPIRTNIGPFITINHKKCVFSSLWILSFVVVYKWT